MAEARECDFSFTAAIRGFHVYRREWSPHLEQRLRAVKEHGNTNHRFAIAVTRAEKDVDDRIVGHLPRELSKVLWYFFLHGGDLECVVTGRRQRSPLEQGGLEIPCRVTLRGKKKIVARAKELLEKKTSVSII